MSQPRWIDIVMPTFNRQAALVRALEALAAQKADDEMGVIVVDDGSETPVEEAIPRELRDRMPIRVLRQQNGGPARARNAGIAESSAEYIGFVDDDVRVDPGWLAAYRAAIAAANSPTAFFGPLSLPANWRPSPWSRWEAETLAIEYGRMLAGVYEPTWRQFFTGNALVRREYLLRAGCFDESFTRAEDIELAIRLQGICGTTFAFVPGAIGWHYAHRTLASWLRIPRAYGAFDIRIDETHPWTGHREQLAGELTHNRNRIARIIRRPANNDRLRAGCVFLATRSALGLSAVGANSVAGRLLSLAYDIEHTNAFFRAAALADARRGGELPINSASTGDGYPASS